MNKDYIKRFFMLTEQNILGCQVSANDEFDSPVVESAQSDKRRLNGFRVGLISIGVGISVAIWTNFFHDAPTTMKPVSQAVKEVSTVNHAKPVVQAQSKIPYYREGANQQTLQQISLHKPAEMRLDDETENLAVVEPVLDKVIVVPKSFG